MHETSQNRTAVALGTERGVQHQPALAGSGQHPPWAEPGTTAEALRIPCALKQPRREGQDMLRQHEHTASLLK